MSEMAWIKWAWEHPDHHAHTTRSEFYWLSCLLKMISSCAWVAPPGCVDHHRALVERHVNSQASVGEFLLFKVKVFRSRAEGEARLQVWAL